MAVLKGLVDFVKKWFSTTKAVRFGGSGGFWWLGLNTF
jgi:hypothetical protein